MSEVERVDNAYSDILKFFERPNRKLTAGDYEFFSKLNKAYSDLKGFENAWGYVCEKEGLYNGIFALAAEVFEASIKMLKAEDIDKRYAYGFVLEDISKLTQTAKSWCTMMHVKAQRI
jgi:virulence-associated protein VapD